MIVDDGHELIALTLKTETMAKYGAVGTGVTTAAAGDTALEQEEGTRVTSTITNTGKTFTYVSVFGANNPVGAEAITEFGLLTASANGTLFVREVFSAVNKETADSLTFTTVCTVA